MYRSGALGDTIVTFAVLQTLRDGLPRAKIGFAAQNEVALLARSCGLVDTVLPVDTGWARAWFAGDAVSMRESTKDFDALFAFTAPDDTLRETAEGAGFRSVHFHPPAPPAEGGVHVVDHLLGALSGNVDVTVQRVPQLRLNAADVALGAEVLGKAGIDAAAPFLFVHTGASAKNRVWPYLGQFARLARERTGFVVVMHAGPVEMEAGFVEGSLSTGVSLLGPFPVSTLAGILYHAAAYVGSDTGPSHLAAALGIPAFTVFGGDEKAIRNAEVWCPRGQNAHTILPLSAAEWTSAEELLERVRRFVSLPGEGLPSK